MEREKCRPTRVILTGATSFIGKAVMEELVAQGCQVFAVVRPGSAGPAAWRRGTAAEAGSAEAAELAPCVLPASLETISGLLTAPSLSDGADAWLHLGWGGAGSANRQNPELQAKNIGYALDALETAGKLGCRRFLFSGSQAEYGICRELMREDMECSPVSEYGKDKLMVCRQAAERARELHIDYIHTRIFSVYGPGDHPWSLVSTCVDTFLKGGHMEMGPCTQQWNYLYITDTAKALTKLLLGKAPSGVYNVAGEDTRPLREYIEEIYRLCGSRGTYEFGNRPPNAEGEAWLMPDIGKLTAATGFRQEVSFEAGIRRLMAGKKSANA